MFIMRWSRPRNPDLLTSKEEPALRFDYAFGRCLTSSWGSFHGYLVCPSNLPNELERERESEPETAALVRVVLLCVSWSMCSSQWKAWVIMKVSVQGQVLIRLCEPPALCVCMGRSWTVDRHKNVLCRGKWTGWCSGSNVCRVTVFPQFSRCECRNSTLK